MSEKIMTLHPDGKKGVNIDKKKYDAVKSAVLASIRDNGEIFFRDLSTAVEVHLPEWFEGSVGWYTTTVKLDLEARGLITRVANKSPQALRLQENN
jgi:hypothetical protein